MLAKCWRGLRSFSTRGLDSAPIVLSPQKSSNIFGVTGELIGLKIIEEISGVEEGSRVLTVELHHKELAFRKGPVLGRVAITSSWVWSSSARKNSAPGARGTGEWATEWPLAWLGAGTGKGFRRIKIAKRPKYDSDHFTTPCQLPCGLGFGSSFEIGS